MCNKWVYRFFSYSVMLVFVASCSPKSTPIPATNTLPIPTNTIPATNTMPITTALPQPSNTVAPPTDTLIPPTETPIPPTETQIASNTSGPTQATFVNPSIYDIPAMYEVTIKDLKFNSITEPIQSLPMKIYYPPNWKTGQMLPAVILANDWPQGGKWTSLNYPLSTLGLLSNYEGWGRIIAANGLIAVAYETAYPDDLEAVVKYIQDNATDLGIDATRLGLFGESSNSMLVGSFSNQENRGYIKFAVYLVGDAELADSPWYQPSVDACKQYGCYFGELPKVTKMRTDLPIFVVNVGNLSPDGVADMNYYLQQVKEQGIPMTYVYFAAGYDGFDYKINTSGMELSPEQMTEGIKIIQQAVDFMKKYASAP